MYNAQSIGIQREKEALVVVDGQPTFMPGGELSVPDGDGILAPLAHLIRSRRFSFVVFSRDWHPEDHFSFSETPRYEDGSWPPHGIQGTPNAEVHPTLLRAAREAKIDFITVSKGMDAKVEAYSAFDGKNLDTEKSLADELRRRDVKRVVFCGLAGEVCVRASVLAGLNEGFNVTLYMPGTRFLGPSEDTVEELRDLGVLLEEDD
jgi:nicotinamidase/pyrazinamidase